MGLTSTHALTGERDEMRRLIHARVADLLSPRYQNVGAEVQALVTAYVKLDEVT